MVDLAIIIIFIICLGVSALLAAFPERLMRRASSFYGFRIARPDVPIWRYRIVGIAGVLWLAVIGLIWWSQHR